MTSCLQAVALAERANKLILEQATPLPHVYTGRQATFGQRPCSRLWAESQRFKERGSCRGREQLRHLTISSRSSRRCGPKYGKLIGRYPRASGRPCDPAAIVAAVSDGGVLQDGNRGRECRVHVRRLASSRLSIKRLRVRELRRHDRRARHLPYPRAHRRGHRQESWSASYRPC